LWGVDAEEARGKVGGCGGADDGEVFDCVDFGLKGLCCFFYGLCGV
jgi:hypothetical protein